MGLASLPSDQTGNTVLLIESETADRLVLESRIRDWGYETLAAEDGAQGIALAREQSVDCILVSHNLSEGSDGAETCRQLRAIPRLVSVPVLLYASQRVTPESIERCYEAGCDGFMQRSQLAFLDRLLRNHVLRKHHLDELMHEVRLLQDEAQRLKFIDPASQAAPLSSEQVASELTSAQPDGLLLVDSQGTVLRADHGALEIFGMRPANCRLSELAPGCGLEGYVRDARGSVQQGFRFELRERDDRPRRQILASVRVVNVSDKDPETKPRVVLLLDLTKRRIADQIIASESGGMPHYQMDVLLEAARAMFQPRSVIGSSHAAQTFRGRLEELCEETSHTLIFGPRGSGKQFAARILHYTGNGSSNIQLLRCNMFEGREIERQLFGPAETGVQGGAPGLVKSALEGTLLLTEVQELPLGCQSRLVRALQEMQSAGPRLIATTRHDPSKLIQSGRLAPEFTSLFGTSSLRVPNLADRSEDISELAADVLARMANRGHVRRIEEEALSIMACYDWPGNMGELVDCVDQACARASGQAIKVGHLTRPLRELHAGLPPVDLTALRNVKSGGGYMTIPAQQSSRTRLERPWDITDDDPISLEHYEKKVLIRALNECGGDKLSAARLLNVGKSTLYRKLKRYHIT